MRVPPELTFCEEMRDGMLQAQQKDRLVDDLLAAGGFEAILPDYWPPPVPLSMLIVPARAGIARVRLLVEFLADQIGAIPGIQQPRAGHQSARSSRNPRGLRCGLSDRL